MISKRKVLILIFFFLPILTACPQTPSMINLNLEKTDIKIWDKVNIQVMSSNPYNHAYEYRFAAERGKVISDTNTNPSAYYYAPFTGGADTITVTVFDRTDNQNLTPIKYPVTVNGESIVYVALANGTLNDNTNGLIKISSWHGLSQTKDVTYGRNPAISPDGKYIAYTYFPGNGSSQIYIKDPAGVETNLTNSSSFNMTPCWAPIGSNGVSSIAFSSDRATDAGNAHGDFYHIWRINANGSDLKQITNINGNDKAPAWSPDGRSIVYSSDYYQNKANNFYNLYKFDITSGTSTPLTNETIQGKGCYEPSFSSDSSKLVYTRKYVWRQLQQEADMQKIWLLDLTQTTNDFGRPVTKQADSAIIENYPSWTVDGRSISYVQNRAGEYSVVSIPLDSIPVNNKEGSIIAPMLEGNRTNVTEAKWAFQYR